MSIYFLICQGCNLACKYCFATDYKTSSKLDMPWRVAKQTMDRCFDVLQPNGKVTINFFGGEPMLNWPLIKKIILYTQELRERPEYSKKRVDYHLTTNLTIMPDDLIEWMKHYEITLLTDVDGPREVHDALRPYVHGGGSYDRIVRHVEMLRENGICYEVRSTITSVNQDRMDEVVDAVTQLQRDQKGCVLEAMCPFEASGNVKPMEMLPDPLRYGRNLLRLYRSGKVDLAAR